ncbi:hypothetical protein [Bacteroides fragilis]|uniref:hypothetical protein n=1 Tax=Bacteroides fragilis TaxID=817 RepID=UPI00189DDF4F|nr:hypothetical protein [Bacteroides fragilis]
MFADKSFQSRIEEANKVFVSALEKLKLVQTDICNRMTENKNQIQKLNEENEGLESMKSQTEKQITEIGRFIG